MAIRRLSLTTLTLLAFAAAAQAQTYVEGVNDTLPVEPGWTSTGGNEIAYRWTAQNSFDLSLVEWHTGPVPSAITRVREDNDGTPGVILREAAYSTGGTGWTGASFGQPLAVQAGESYFVTFTSVTVDYHSFLAAGGVHLTYLWTPNGSSSWNGPFDWAGHRMIRFFAPGEDQCPGDVNGDNHVDLSDLAVLLGHFGQSGNATRGEGDLDGDADVDLSDLATLLANFGLNC